MGGARALHDRGAGRVQITALVGVRWRTGARCARSPTPHVPAGSSEGVRSLQLPVTAIAYALEIFNEVPGRGVLGSPYTGFCIPVRPRDRSRARSRPLVYHRYMHLATRLDGCAPSRIVGSRGSSWRFELLRTSLGISRARVTGASPQASPIRRSGAPGAILTHCNQYASSSSSRSATWKTPPRGATSGPRIHRSTTR
jgi:hypothetical protein